MSNAGLRGLIYGDLMSNAPQNQNLVLRRVGHRHKLVLVGLLHIAVAVVGGGHDTSYS